MASDRFSSCRNLVALNRGLLRQADTSRACRSKIPTAVLFGCVGKLVTPGDCKSSARKALLVRVQRHPPSL
jgi:hypothetical protein